MEYGYVKRAILRGLSENSRASITELAKLAKCSRNTVMKSLKSLEDEFNIKYTINFNKDAIGLYQKHMVTVKFEKKPSVEVLQKLFKDNPTVHLAALTEGAFDLLVYAVTDSPKRYLQWETKMAQSLIEYGPTIKPSQLIITHIGFVPVLDQTLRDINITRLGLDELDRKILVLLNSNSRISYNSIARQTKTSEDVIRYRYKRIIETGIIRQMTISMGKPPLPYMLVFFINYKFRPGTEQRGKKAREHYMTIDGPMPLINNFQFMAQLSGSYRTIIVGCFNNEKEAMEIGVKAHKKFFAEDRASTTHARIVELVKGTMPIRNMDIRKSYVVINWDE